jgi:ribose transport system ATP-binding protein
VPPEASGVPAEAGYRKEVRGARAVDGGDTAGRISRSATALLTSKGEALSARGIRKQYGGIHALDGADVSVGQAEIHAILGENGAGKSTLVKIIAGVERPDEGKIHLGGQVLNPRSPQDVRDAGIATVYQELSLISQLSVTHNLVLSDLPKRMGLLSLRRAERIAEEALAKLGLLNIDLRAPVGELPLDQQQLVEIAKATMTRPRILILDEATSSLSGAEVDRLFDLVRGLRDQGTTVVVITHRMHEVWALADSMTILRDGRTVGRYDVTEIGQREAVGLMAGRDIRAVFPAKHSAVTKATALELRDVRLHRDQAPWALELHRGEILGLGGLQGQGQREFLHWLYGSGSGSGTVLRDGVRVRIRRPVDALRHGIVLIPEDRAVEGLHPNLPVRWNLAMATLRRRSRLGVIRMGAEKKFAATTIRQMAIKASSPFQPVSALSGGTQQKVVIGKFMATKPAVLLFVDSTRGIDVQTKFEFYEMLRGLARSGATCVLYSSDTEELVGLCDRVAVFHDGVAAIMLKGDEVTQDAVVAASFAVARESV